MSKPIIGEFFEHVNEQVSPKKAFGRILLFHKSELKFPTNFDYNEKIINQLKLFKIYKLKRNLKNEK